MRQPPRVVLARFKAGVTCLQAPARDVAPMHPKDPPAECITQIGIW